MKPELPPRQRKRPSHSIIESPSRQTIVFVTVCTSGRRPLLTNENVHSLLRTVWKSAGAWLLGRYVLMPDHIHFFAGIGSPELPLTNWISFWKRAFTRRFGQPIWQEDYWDTTLRDAGHANERWEYIRQNPVRAGLVSDADKWQWQGELNCLSWP